MRTGCYDDRAQVSSTTRDSGDTADCDTSSLGPVPNRKRKPIISFRIALNQKQGRASAAETRHPVYGIASDGDTGVLLKVDNVVSRANRLDPSWPPIFY